jgi:hypothetical protein
VARIGQRIGGGFGAVVVVVVDCKLVFGLQAGLCCEVPLLPFGPLDATTVLVVRSGSEEETNQNKRLIRRRD